MIEGWYLSVAAVELERVCDGARLVRAAGQANRDAAIYWATAVICGRSWLLDLYIAEQPRR